MSMKYPENTRYLQNRYVKVLISIISQVSLCNVLKAGLTKLVLMTKPRRIENLAFWVQISSNEINPEITVVILNALVWESYYFNI